MNAQNTVFVGGLSWNTNEQGIEDSFSQFGAISSLRLITDRETGRSRGFAFVTFDSYDDALSAIENMDGKEFEGRVIKVNFAEAGKKRDTERTSRW